MLARRVDVLSPAPTCDARRAVPLCSGARARAAHLPLGGSGSAQVAGARRRRLVRLGVTAAPDAPPLPQRLPRDRPRRRGTPPGLQSACGLPVSLDSRSLCLRRRGHGPLARRDAARTLQRVRRAPWRSGRVPPV
eukprot:6481633-Prymnesium_polylepis.1